MPLVWIHTIDAGLHDTTSLMVALTFILFPIRCHHLYINLRRSCDGTLFVCLLPALHSVRFGQLLSCAHKRNVNIMKVYIERNNIQVELIWFRKKYRLYWHWKLWSRTSSFATAVFTKLGSLLSGTSRHCSVLGAPVVSGHARFGTRHFRTYSIRYIVTSGHVQLGT